MKKFSDHIAIIGAGIAGLAAANFLQIKNIPCVVFERSKYLGEHGAGISISPNGINVLNELGLIEELRLISGNPKKAIFFSSSKKITAINVSTITTSRKSLHAILQNRYISNGGEIIYDHELKNINFDNLNLTFSNKINYQCAHILGCDGIKSDCRKQIFKDDKAPIYSGYSVWRSIIPNNQNDIEFYLGPNYHVVTYPINNKEVSFVAAIKEPKKNIESWKEKGNYKDLDKFLPNFILNKYSQLQDNSPIFKWGIYLRPDIGTYFKNHLTLLGDAAHPIVPFMGQGGCLALEDAYTFANLLNKNDKKFQNVQLKFQEMRLPRVLSIHKKSMRQAMLNHLSNPILVFIRNLLMKYTPIIRLRTQNIWNFDVKK